ncbi:MAG: FAD-binding oxidoreductase [Deltaproteobacteria bacterium]|nr:FAD-binding oxidoreductase [Deltaproteobacteria bacterium]
MAEWTRQALAGWGRWPVIESQVSRPERRSELVRAVRETNGQGLLAHGLGRSYGDAALLQDGRVVLTRRLDRMLAFDEATGWLRCEAGVSYEDVLATFVPRGFFPPVTPGTKFVTFGGALASDVHGKNHHGAGCFSDHVRSFDLLVGDGSIVTVTREGEPELFQATAGGMGLTGVILALEVRLERIANPYSTMESVRVESLAHFFEVAAASHGSTHTVSWIDCVTRGKGMGRGIFMRGGHAPADAPVPTREGLAQAAKRLAHPVLEVPFDAPSWALNGATVRAFNEVYFRRHPRGARQSLVHYDPFFYPLDAVRGWNRIYGRRGFLQYQMVVPHDPEHRAIRAILDAITASRMGSFLAVIKEFGDRDNGGLSFPRGGVTLALDFANTGQPLLDLMLRLDAITLEAGGRVYLGKDARLPRDTFRAMYPNWEAWKAVRDRWDPSGLFQSELGRRLGLCDRHDGGRP